MGSLADLSDLINRASGGNGGNPQTVFWHKVPRIAGAAATANIAGRPCTLWRYDGDPCGGAVPATGVDNPTNATTGSIPFTNPSGSNEANLIQAWATALGPGTLILYDRLLQAGGLSATTTTPQNTSGTLTRNTAGIGNIAFAEIHTQIGASSSTILMTYVNENDVLSTGVATLFGNTNYREATRAILLPLKTGGDRGIKEVRSVTVGVTTGTAGNFSLVIGKPIAYIGIGTGGAPGWRDFVVGMPGIPKIEPNSCLSLLWFPGTTTASDFFGGLSIVEA